MGSTSAIPESRRTPHLSQESEVELLSPYEMGSLSPTKLSMASTKVKRTRPDRRHEGLRTLAIAVGGTLIVVLGLSVGVLGVVLAGIR